MPSPKPLSSASCVKKSSASGALRERRNCHGGQLTPSPGARPMPKSMRLGCSASSRRYDSATLSDEWLGSITPASAEAYATRHLGHVSDHDFGVVVAIPGMLWCSAYQRRRKPRRSTVRASSTAPLRAAALVRAAGEGDENRARRAGGGTALLVSWGRERARPRARAERIVHVHVYV